MLLDPKVVAQYAVPILIITIVVVLGKVITCSLGVFLTGRSTRTSLQVGLGLAQIGEFSFIIASMGMTLNIASSFLFPIAVTVCVITAFLTPYLIKYSDPILMTLSKCVPNPIIHAIRGYTLWVNRISSSKMQLNYKEYLYKSLLYVVVNLFLIMGIFFVAIYIATSEWGVLLATFIDKTIFNTIIWAGALLFSLPFLIAIYRTIKAFTSLLLPLGSKKSLKPALSPAARGLILEGIPILAIVIVSLIIILMSWPILPSKIGLILTLVIVVFLAIFLYEWFIKLHTHFRTRVKKGMEDKHR